MQRRKHVKYRFLWAGKKPETTMAECIISTTTPRELAGSTLAIGELETERVVNRSKYDRLDCNLPKARAAICFILSLELLFGCSKATIRSEWPHVGARRVHTNFTTL